MNFALNERWTWLYENWPRANNCIGLYGLFVDCEKSQFRRKILSRYYVSGSSRYDNILLLAFASYLQIQQFSSVGDPSTRLTVSRVHINL